MAEQEWPTDLEILQDDAWDGIPQMQYQLPDEDAGEEDPEEEEEQESEE